MGIHYPGSHEAKCSTKPTAKPTVRYRLFQYYWHPRYTDRDYLFSKINKIIITFFLELIYFKIRFISWFWH